MLVGVVEMEQVERGDEEHRGEQRERGREHAIEEGVRQPRSAEAIGRMVDAMRKAGRWLW